MMKRSLMKAAGALAMLGSVIATAPAQARPWDHGGGYSHGGGYGGYGYRDRYRGYGGYRGYRGYGGYGRGYYRDDAGLALGVGVLGLALGAVIASDRARDYDSYDRGYGYPGYGY